MWEAQRLLQVGAKLPPFCLGIASAHSDLAQAINDSSLLTSS